MENIEAIFEHFWRIKNDQKCTLYWKPRPRIVKKMLARQAKHLLPVLQGFQTNRADRSVSLCRLWSFGAAFLPKGFLLVQMASPVENGEKVPTNKKHPDYPLIISIISYSYPIIHPLYHHFCHMAVCQNPGTPSEPQNSWDLWMFIPLKYGIYRY